MASESPASRSIPIGGAGGTPADEPFVVRPSMPKRLGMVLPMIAVVVVACGGLGAVLLAVLARDSGAGVSVFAITLAVLMAALVVTAPVILVVLLFVRPRPLVAIGPGGLWIAAGRARDPLTLVAWPSMARVDLRRRFLRSELRVQTETPRPATLATSLWGVDRSRAEIMAAVAHYSGGQVEVAERGG